MNHKVDNNYFNEGYKNNHNAKIKNSYVNNPMKKNYSINESVEKNIYKFKK